MRESLTFLLHFQRFFVPALLVLLVFAIWRTVVRRDMGVGLALYLGLVVIVDGFYNTGIYVPGLEKGSIRYSEVCALFLIIGRPPRARERSSLRSSGVSAMPLDVVTHLVTLYFALVFLSTLHSSSVSGAMLEFRRVMIPQMITFFVVRRCMGSPEALRRFVLSLMALVLIIALFSFWDAFFDRWLLHSEHLESRDYYGSRIHGRIGGLFINPNYLGAFMVLAFPLLFLQTMNEAGRWKRLYGAVSLMALAFALVETQSRGPLIAIALALVTLIVIPFHGISRARRFIHLAFFLLVFALFMPGFYQHAIERFSYMEEETSTAQRSRESVWNYTFKIIEDHPVQGIGFGEREFVAVMDEYGFRNRYGEESLDNPHNSYLQMAVYAGIPALVTFLFANLALLAQAVRLFKQGSSGKSIALGLLVGILGFLTCNYTDMHMFTGTVGPIYWAFFALLLSMARNATETTPKNVNMAECRLLDAAGRREANVNRTKEAT